MFFKSEIFFSVPVWKNVEFAPRLEVGFLNEHFRFLNVQFQRWRNQFGTGVHVGFTVLGFNAQLELDFERTD